MSRIARKRYTAEQIIGKSREAEMGVASATERTGLPISYQARYVGYDPS